MAITTALLLPPSIDGKLPAQIGDTLCIPFQHSRAVGAGDYKGFSLKITSISNNIEIGTLSQEESNYNIDQIIFNNDTIELQIGQFYKAQLAYINNVDEVGYYSTVGIFKYTAQPLLEISTEFFGIKLTGKYQNENDSTEKPYSYKFDIYKDGLLFESSGEILHDHSKQDWNDYYAVTKMYDLNKSYTIIYQVTTINKLEIQISQEFNLVRGTPTTATLNVTSNAENGYNAIFINNATLSSGEKFILLRRVQNSNWEILHYNITITGIIEYRDFTIEQGTLIEYKLYQLYNDGTIGESVTAQVVPEFEDMFLSDDERQLCIRFNPKVSSFKETILESKQDTIGGQYPFFFRNGNTRYKEFSISGLITYHMDNENFFFQTNVDKNINAKRSSTNSSQAIDTLVINTNLSGSNIALERKFKLAVLEWLNNGKPKVFRSPTEGNYIIRLMNVSLSPNDQLGRMLHTFQATAYEIGECNQNNLRKFGLLSEVEKEKNYEI